jgi:uncharacterized RDD family membrane protein YckC
MSEQHPPYPSTPEQPYQHGGPPQPGQPAPYAGPPPPGYHGTPLPPLAHWGMRVGAFLIDLLLIVPGYVVAGIGSAFTDSSGSPTVLGLLLVFVGYVAAFAVALWNLTFRQGRTGWSVGKQVLGIRLLAERSMQPLGPGLTFVRGLAHVLDSLPCYLGYLWPLWDAKRQTFADKVMSTVVVVQQRPQG